MTLFLLMVVIVALLSQFCNLALSDIIVLPLAFLPTWWALLQNSQVGRLLMKALGLWEFVKMVARFYDCLMGLVIFFLVIVCSWFSSVSEFQTRFYTNWYDTHTIFDIMSLGFYILRWSVYYSKTLYYDEIYN